jgi:hypothetical protein
VEIRPAQRLSVTFPDGSHSQIPLTPRQTLRQTLEVPYRNRGLSFIMNPPHLQEAATGRRAPVRLENLASEYVDCPLVIGMRPARSGVRSPADKEGKGGCSI